MGLIEGAKYDQEKLRWDLVPPEFEEVVKVLDFGARKYEPRNWEKGIVYGRVIAATFRHLWSWIRGERNDPETGLHHLAHANCCILFLLTYELRGMTDFDDRPDTRRGALAAVPPSQPGLQPYIPATSDSTTGSGVERGKAIIQGYFGIVGQPDRQLSLDPLVESVHNAP